MDGPVVLHGVLLAAGRSSRMGRSKALLPWGCGDSTTVVAAAFDLIRQFAAGGMFVTLGHDAAAIRSALADRDFQAVDVDPGARMFESVRAAMNAILSLERRESVLLHPVDAPGVSTQTIELIIEQSRGDPDRVVLPQYHGKGGHPVLIPARFIEQIAHWPGEGGLRAFWRQIPRDVIRVPVDDSAVIMDLDTPAQYSLARRACESPRQ